MSGHKSGFREPVPGIEYRYTSFVVLKEAFLTAHAKKQVHMLVQAMLVQAKFQESAFQQF